MSYLSPIIKSRLEEKLAKLNKLRPLPKSAVQKLREKFQIEMTYNSNAIEGNSLTLKETFLVINEGLTVKGKPLKDHLEAKDHHAALEYLYDLIDKNKKHTVSEMLIKNLHQIILQETNIYPNKMRYIPEFMVLLSLKNSKWCIVPSNILMHIARYLFI